MAFDQILLNAFHHQFLALVVYGGCQRHDARRAPALKIRNLEMRIERVAGVQALRRFVWNASPTIDGLTEFRKAEGRR